MPVRPPRKGETQDDFIASCMHEVSQGDSSRSNEQNLAICFQTWRDAQHSEKACDPNDYDDREEFMSDCTDEGTDEDACSMMWENKAATAIRHKTHTGTVSGLEFVMSDETVDRMDDVILSDGWNLDNFRKAPRALFNHCADFVIGKWENVRIDNKQLRGHLQLAKKGTSARIDEIISLVEQGLLNTVSVGFRPLETTARKDAKHGGSVFVRSELVEVSLVSIPANANALAVAKSLKISPATIDLVFAKDGDKDVRIERRGFAGEQAKASSRNGKGSAMNGLAQRITDLETQIVAKRDLLLAHLDKMDNSNVSDADLEENKKLNFEIEHLEKTREGWINSEKLLAKNASADPTTNGSGRGRAVSTMVAERIHHPPPVIASRKKELDLLDYLVRAATVSYVAKAEGKPVHETRQRIYGDDEGTHAFVDIVTRAASAPALTTVAGWAAELAQTTYADLMPLLMPKAILTRLAPKGLTLSFGAAGRIVIPTRSRTPSLAGSFVGEGLAIPVRQGAFTSQTLTPKKMAVISTWTREMGDHSIPAIEGLIREAIQQDTSVAIDSVLLDANAATAIRPAGLLNGVAATTATSGGGIAAFVGDVVGLINAISANTYGNIRNLVWLVNQTDMLRAAMLSAANTGIFPFRDEIRGGTVAGIPFIDSQTVTAKTMILVDAADFVVVGGEAPRMEMSDQATLHMEDTNPLDLVASPSTVAAPQRSLFQTDSLALRMVMPLNWLQRRAGTIAWTQSVTW